MQRAAVFQMLIDCSVRSHLQGLVSLSLWGFARFLCSPSALLIPPKPQHSTSKNVYLLFLNNSPYFTDTDREALDKLQQEGSGGPSASLTLVKPNGAQLAEIFELIAADKVKLEVAKVGGWVCLLV